MKRYCVLASGLTPPQALKLAPVEGRFSLSNGRSCNILLHLRVSIPR